MFSTFAKAGLGLLIASSIACVGIDIKTEVLPHDTGGGTVCLIGGANWQGRTLVEFEPQIGLGGFSFGTSGIFTVPQSSTQYLYFTSYDTFHTVWPRPQVSATWGSWVQSPVGSDDVGYVSL